jgi:hypothetical protein
MMAFRTCSFVRLAMSTEAIRIYELLDICHTRNDFEGG